MDSFSGLGGFDLEHLGVARGGKLDPQGLHDGMTFFGIASFSWMMHPHSRSNLC
jgi:hypothetical protein